MHQNMFRIFLSAACALVMSATQAAPIKDDAGHTLDLRRPAMRVITLAPSLTEMLYEVGGGDKLVGTVEYSNFPPAAKDVERIGSNQKLDLERIAALKPDLVLVWYHGNALREVERITALGIPMFYLEPHTIADIPDVLERIGQLIGNDRQAQEAAQRFRARHAALKAQYTNRAPINVFYQISSKPLMTINNQQIISDVIQLCGGVNVFGKEPMLVPQLSTESVVAINPDVILASHLGTSEGGAVRDPNGGNVKSWNTFAGMKAVRTGQIWLIPGDQISRHGPRILEAAQAVCTALDAARAASK
ncbi:MAG TPA: cobalamin-binding protein [Rhodocyclaceae bacterium]|nr:cobalamin-binding protein [Rhodocyclaceae bacterium]